MSNGGSERSWLARVAIKSRYKRRRATHCVALVAAHGGEHRQAAGAVGPLIFEITGDSSLPGLGRVEGIKRQDGQWVVVTARGLITSAP